MSPRAACTMKLAHPTFGPKKVMDQPARCRHARRTWRKYRQHLKRHPQGNGRGQTKAQAPPRGQPGFPRSPGHLRRPGTELERPTSNDLRLPTSAYRHRVLPCFNPHRPLRADAALSERRRDRMAFRLSRPTPTTLFRQVFRHARSPLVASRPWAAPCWRRR